MGDFESEAQRLCGFLGLEFRDGMRAFAARAQAQNIDTPSSAQVASSDQTHCSIVSGEKGNSTTITAQPSGDGSRFTIVAMTKKSSN
jgi:hypothetical protein